MSHRLGYTGHNTFSYRLAGLKDKRDSVQREIEQKNRMDAALAQANTTMMRLNHDITDISSRLDSFAKEWANVRKF